MDKLKPFKSVKNCPACEADFRRDVDGRETVDISFCESVHLRAGKHVRSTQKYLDTTTSSSKRIGHLHVTCRRCGYEWEEKTASAE